MNRRHILLLLVAAVIAVGVAESTVAAPYIWPVRRSRYYDWNKPYAHTAYGQPVALVVPPTATLQTNWGWGVGSSRLERLDHQFMRNYPGYPGYGGFGGYGGYGGYGRYPGYGGYGGYAMGNCSGYGAFGGAYRTTPIWPSDTTQFGVYHVRGPW